MIEVRVAGQALDLADNTTLSYTLSNSIFSSKDTSSLPGSYSFPFRVPANNRNNAILYHPNSINSAVRYKDKNAELHFDGVLLFTGTLGIESADNYTINLFMVATQVADLKDIKLPALDLGGVREIGSEALMLLHAKQTAEFPLDWDYVFFPVINQEYIPGKTNPMYYWFQNYWNSITGSFQVNDTDKILLMPFVRIDYILKQGFAQTDYTFVNEFQTTDELRKLVLYNNYSLYGKDGLAESINLALHVPDIGFTDFLKRICAAFCLGVFTNSFSKKIRLIPIQKILSAPTITDWTEKLHHEYGIKHGKSDAIAAICYPSDDKDAMFKLLASLVKPTTFDTVDTFADMFAAGSGTYYIRNLEAYWERGARTRMIYNNLGCAPNETDTPRLEPGIPPLIDVFGFSTVGDHTYNQVPRIDQPGTVTYKDGVDDNGADIWKEQKGEIPVRMTFYRGMYEDGEANIYPLAAGIRYDIPNNELGEYSLKVDGPNGIYNKWWRLWQTANAQGRYTTRKLNLEVSDLLTFDFDQKVRIDNMDYLVKSLKINLTMKGIAPTDAELISVI